MSSRLKNTVSVERELGNGAYAESQLVSVTARADIPGAAKRKVGFVRSYGAAGAEDRFSLERFTIRGEAFPCNKDL